MFQPQNQASVYFLQSVSSTTGSHIFQVPHFCYLRFTTKMVKLQRTKQAATAAILKLEIFWNG